MENFWVVVAETVAVAKDQLEFDQELLMSLEALEDAGVRKKASLVLSVKFHCSVRCNPSPRLYDLNPNQGFQQIHWSIFSEVPSYPDDRLTVLARANVWTAIAKNPDKFFLQSPLSS